jgi:hypothetical protein
MFLDYLINVALVGVTYWSTSLVLFVLGFVYRTNLGKDIWSGVKGIAIFLSIWGLIAGMTSSANTYKNTVDYSRVQDQRRIEQLQAADAAPQVTDRTRQRLTDEQLQERAVDMRERVENLEQNQ